MTENQELIATMKAQGRTNKAIVAALGGRNPRVISQIMSGQKPYKNLTPALRALAKTPSGQKLGTLGAKETARRVTKAGKEAGTRKKLSEIVTPLEGGRHVSPTGGRKTILKELKRARGENRRIKMSVKVKSAKFYGKEKEANPTINLYKKGGYEAELLLDRVDQRVMEGMTHEQALRDVVREDLQNLGYLDKIGAIETIEMNVADTFAR